jgi:hypothetical protein
MRAGLTRLDRELRSGADGGAERAVLSLLEVSPGLPELGGVWTVQATVRNPKIVSALLACLAALLRMAHGAHGQPHGQHAGGGGEASTSAAGAAADRNAGQRKRRKADRKQQQAQTQQAPEQQQQQPLPAETLAAVRALQADLTDSILRTRMKPLYHALGHDSRSVSSGALDLLTAIAQQGPGPARELASVLDFSLPALGTLARPARDRSAAHARSGGGGGDGAEPGATRGPAYWRTWGEGAPK